MDDKLPVVLIERYDFNPTETRGAVSFDGVRRLQSYELPDKNNKKGESCIPVGKYRGTRHITKSYPRERFAYLIKDVPGRDGILIHSGNTSKDTSGCILLGRSFGKLEIDGKKVDAILDSKKAMAELQDFLKDRDFELVIMEARNR